MYIKFELLCLLFTLLYSWFVKLIVYVKSCNDLSDKLIGYVIVCGWNVDWNMNMWIGCCELWKGVCGNEKVNLCVNVIEIDCNWDWDWNCDVDWDCVWACDCVCEKGKGWLRECVMCENGKAEPGG